MTPYRLAIVRWTLLVGCLSLTLVLGTLPAAASSHREAPAITRAPQVDGTDFYMFRSYEPGREGFVTLIANYNPLQDPYGGPNYFPLDPQAAYDIHINNNGGDNEAGQITEDITFRFRFQQRLNPFILDIGGTPVAVPLVQVSPFGPGFGNAGLTQIRTYSIEVIRGSVDDLGLEPGESVINPRNNRRLFGMPFDYIGTKSIPNYPAYAARFVHELRIPGCSTSGKVFAGQRRESFAVNLGETFDLVNIGNPLGAPDAEVSTTSDQNITTLALEVPIDCLTGDSSVIGGWTTARLPRTRSLTDKPTFDAPDFQSGELVQVSRLANPLVNEVAIGLPDKNLFNASHPRDDGANFLQYVTNPTLPALLEILFGTEAPKNFPRNDLVAVFLTGIPGLNDDGSVGEVMRLNTAVPPTLRADQRRDGVAAGDPAGYPNGRRPGDDTVDISLKAVMGILCHLGVGLCDPADAPAGLLPFTDGAIQNALQFDNAFPYLTTPIPGSPN